MNREQAWTHYFTTGDREPLVKAYSGSIEYMVSHWFPRSEQEDMVQVGLMGLLKAINKIDSKRVKSKDAWVWLNVKGMIINARKPKPTESLDRPIKDDRGNSTTYLDQLNTEDETDFDLLLKDLPARQRLILSLIYRHDWHKTEIARMLGISSMRVGQVEQQALKVLRTGGEVVNAPL